MSRHNEESAAEIVIFTKQDYMTAEAGFRNWANKPIWRAVVLRNALQAFLVDVNLQQGPKEYSKLLCVDTHDIVAFANPSRATEKSFLFDNLITPPETQLESSQQQALKRKCSEIDRMITRHLLFDRADGCLLLDPYAEELSIVFQAISREHDEKDQQLLGEMMDGGLFSLDEKQFSGIAKWMSETPTSQAPREFFEFRDNFLPSLRTNLIGELYTLDKAKNYTHQFLKFGNYSFLGHPSIGKRSLFTQLSANLGIELNWQQFKEYYEEESIQADLAEIQSIFIQFAEMITKPTQNKELKAAALSRDGQVIATIHILNSFFERENVPARVEMVSRSMTMHTVCGLLPNNRINVRLRHPLFLPEIYKFDASSLQTIAHIFQSVDNAVKPYMDVSPIPYGDSELHGPKNDQSNEITKSNYHILIHTIRAQTQELIHAFADTIAVQQVLERDEPSKLIQNLLSRAEVSIRKQPKGVREEFGAKDELEPLAHILEHIFRLIADNLRKHRDPFSLKAISTIAEQNKALISFERKRIGTKDQNITFRYINIKRTKSIYPVEFTAIRPTSGKLPRVFHIYSSKIKKIILNGSATVRKDYSEYRSVVVKEDLILDLAFDALSGNQPSIPVSTGSKKNSQQIVIQNMEATLLACIIFSSHGQYAAAATIAATILNQVTKQLHIIETGSSKYTTEAFGDSINDPVVLLALKELFLLRHYCERAIAINQLHYREFDLPTPKGETARCLTRAQRDLDLAVLMNENAEKIALGVSDRRYSATGIYWFHDLRFPIIHFSAWLDQFVAILSSKDQNAFAPAKSFGLKSTQELWRRHEIWTLAGLAKESEVFVDTIEHYKSTARKTGAYRYLAHAQARALQNNLLLFIVLLAYDVAPEFQTFWSRKLEPRKDNLLVFRNWKIWFNHYTEIANQFDFDIRSFKFITDVCSTITAIEEIRAKGGDKQRFDRVVSDLLTLMNTNKGKFFHSEPKEFSFLENLTRQLALKVNSLR